MHLLQSPLLAKIPGLNHGFTTLQTPLEFSRELTRSLATAKQVHKNNLIWADAPEEREREADAVATFSQTTGVGVYPPTALPSWPWP